MTTNRIRPLARASGMAGLALSLVLGIVPGTGLTQSGVLPGAVPGEVLIGVKRERDVPAQIALDVAAVGGVAERLPGLSLYRIRLRSGLAIPNAVTTLRGLAGVQFAEPNFIVRATATPNDPQYPNQYGPQNTATDDAWDHWQPLAPTIVGVIDSGVDSDHPELTDKILRDAQGIVGYNAFSRQRDNAKDDHGHGTHVAGIIAARTNNSLGVAGIAGWNGQAGASDTTFTRIMPLRALKRDGDGASGSILDVDNAIVWAVDHGARVINMSLGGDIPNWSPLNGGPQSLEAAVQYADDRGCILVAAAGNNGSTQLQYPALIGTCVSVGAVDASDTLWSGSNYGGNVEIAAPGVSILSTKPTYATVPGGSLSYGNMTGTSMAAPHVAGAAALMMSQNPALDHRVVRFILTCAVDPYHPLGSRELGARAGRLNVAKALAAGGRPTISLKIPSQIIGGPPFPLGLVELSQPAPAGGARVLLMQFSDFKTYMGCPPLGPVAPSGVSVPGSVTIAAGSKSAPFLVTTSPDGGGALLLALYGDGLASRSVSVSRSDPRYIAELGVDQTVLRGGRYLILKIIALGSINPTDIVELTSSVPAFRVPSQTRVTPTQSSLTLRLLTPAVRARTVVTITAKFGRAIRTVTFTLTP